jgi:TolB-like protein/Tfp pilus assembly protein PilF
MTDLTDDKRTRVQEQVDRILSSATFSGSERHRRFLRFVVEQALKGETEKLNEFVLGFEVFDKNASFDPRIDSIVRVEARRLRERLKKYYQIEGQNDPVIITLRPRSFVPEFEDSAGEKPASPARLGAWLPTHKTIAVAAVALVLGAIGGAVLLSLRDRRPPIPQTSSIVVLPFQNLAPAPAQEMLGDSIADSIITELASVPGLRVISRGSSLQFKESGQTPAQFASDLKVDYVVEGTVQLKQGRVVVSAKLTDTHSQSYVWAQTQETELKKLPDFERELSSAIASRIHVPPPPPGAEGMPRKRAATLESYSAFLKGQYFLYQWDSGGAEKSVALFEEAVRGDPDYAPAWAWLSQAYLLLIYRDDGQDAATISKGRQAALKALSLDDQLAAAHAAAGSYAALDWDWKSAERGFRRAVELDPGWAQGYLMYARMFLIPNGRIQEATRAVLRAHELDPLTQFTRMSLAEVLYFNRDYVRAVAEYEDLRKPAAKANPPDGMYFMALSFLGQSKRAVADLSQALPAGDLSPVQAVLGYLEAKSGERQNAQAILDRLLESSRQRYVPPIPIAILSVGLNNRDEAFRQLRRAVTRHVPSIVNIAVDPVFDPLKSDSRYEGILRDIGLKAGE